MSFVDKIMSWVKDRDPEQYEFHQAVEGVLDTIGPVLERNPGYRRLAVVERIIEPERVISFRVPWMDDGDPGTGESWLPGANEQRPWLVQGGGFVFILLLIWIL